VGRFLTLRTSLVRRRERGREQGQMIVLFAICLVAMISVAGMLMDGGMASATRRQAQNAADTAAMAAAQALATSSSATTAAQTIASANGFPNTQTDCAGTSITGVTVNNPPTSGSHSGDSNYIEVIVQRPMRTGFASIVGQTCWMVSARAVASVNASAVATCSFCALNDTTQNHTLVLKNSSTLRVDGDIYVNSSNGGYTPGTCVADPKSTYKVCGDAFDVFGTGGSISAKTIAVNGGWETHDQNIATADGLATGCSEHPNPAAQTQSANVCIHMPQITDPLNDPSQPGNVVNPPTPGSRPIAGQNGCPSTALSSSGTASSPSLLTISSGTPTICPGTYYGGIKITAGTVAMQPGVYNIIGGGFAISGAANLDGSAGVMIYNASGTGEAVNTTPGSDHVPAPITGHYNPKLSTGLTSTPNPSNPGDTVTYTMTIDKNGSTATPSGTVDFYDGDTIVCPSVAMVTAGGTKMKATCSQTYSVWGSRAMSAAYSGDNVYNGIGDTLTQVITMPTGVSCTAKGSTCNVNIATTGIVKLYGPSTGQYAGLTIFQDRTSNLAITLAPGSSGVTCPSGFMTASLSGAAAWKDGCGALGGLQGTIYAPNDDALVLITASGLSPLQVIAGEIEVDSGAQARFAYNASVFANGHVHLVE
jgi:Flp pilus assembly protein TadG